MRKLEELWESWCRTKGVFWGLLLRPLSFLYGAVSLALRRGMPEELPGLDVISVGNLSMGGSGKTPLCQLIAKEALRRRLKPALILRGYGGDEAALYPGLPVFSGADRLAGAEKAKAAGCRLAILDDGFQRRHQLARRLDILVLDWSRGDVEGHCLPAGRLREPLSAAREADAVVVTHAPKALKDLPGPYQGLKLFHGEHRPLRLRSLHGSRYKPLSWLKKRRITALSAIGKPAGFEGLLKGLGAVPSPLRFPDHHAYAEGEARLLPGTEALVCTAKDEGKLGALAHAWVLEMEMKVGPEREFLKMLFP